MEIMLLNDTTVNVQANAYGNLAFLLFEKKHKRNIGGETFTPSRVFAWTFTV